MKIHWLGILALFGLAACATQTQTPFTLAGSKWTLTGMTQNGTMQQPVAGIQVTLEFSQDGQVTGNSGCNSYSGKFETQGEILKISSLASTLRACADANAMAFESGYQTGLAGAQTFQRTGNQLTIMFGNGTGKLEFVLQ